MKYRFRTCLPLALIITVAFSLGGGALAAGVAERLDKADAAINDNTLDEALKILSEVETEGLEDQMASRYEFLYGKAEYIQIVSDIRSCRADGSQTNNELQDHQTTRLKSALAHFQASYKLDADAPHAPEALYATGLILDYGCLSHFDEAMAAYKLTSDSFPDTDIGKAALKKYNIIKSMYSGKAHGHP